MDFFDPQKQKQHTIRLAVGYALIGVGLVLATTILLYRAYGFGIDRHGRVIQSGLVFVSSQPDGADVLINGKKYKDGTNTRMSLPTGQYTLELRRNGYQSWKRAVNIDGGSVERLIYPLLIPHKLTTTVTKQYVAAPALATQSLDDRWLLVATADPNTFDLFDLEADKLIAKPLVVPAELLAAGSATTSWQTVEWAKDSRYVLLRRLYDKAGQAGSEYLLFDRDQPALSQNLSVTLGFTPTTIELRNQAHDQYYLFNQASGQLFTASLKEPTPQPLLEGVLAFAAEGDLLLFATERDAPAGKVLIRLQQKTDPALTLRQVPAGTTYLLELARYGGDLYAVAGAHSEGRVSLYREPLARLKSRPTEVVLPLQVLKISAPTRLLFSPNKRFVAVQSADRLAVFDAETNRGYNYAAPAPLDQSSRVVWADNFRLGYVSAGKQVIFDFDGANLRSLATVNPAFSAFFDRDQRFVYTLNAEHALTSTALRTPEDL